MSVSGGSGSKDANSTLSGITDDGLLGRCCSGRLTIEQRT